MMAAFTHHCNVVGTHIQSLGIQESFQGQVYTQYDISPSRGGRPEYSLQRWEEEICLSLRRKREVHLYWQHCRIMFEWQDTWSKYLPEPDGFLQVFVYTVCCVCVCVSRRRESISTRKHKRTHAYRWLIVKRPPAPTGILEQYAGTEPSAMEPVIIQAPGSGSHKEQV